MMIKGSIVAMVTPMDTNGAVDERGLRRLVEDDDSRGIRSDLTVRMRSILGACAAERF